MKSLLPLLLAGAIALPVAAAAPQERGEVARLQAEFRDEQARARRLRAEADDAAAEIVQLERELARLTAAVSADDVLISAQRARLGELGRREAVLVARLSQARGRQSRLLSALQMMSRKPPPPLLVPADEAASQLASGLGVPSGIAKFMAMEALFWRRVLAKPIGSVRKLFRRGD